VISEALAGKRIALTGATGFLGTALTEKLLRSVPECELVLLVRPGRRGAAERIRREVLRNDAFDRLRESLGRDGFAAECDQRIQAVAADVSLDGLGCDTEARDLLAGCDTVIHAAAAVAFDNPFDLAIETNLLGPIRLVELLADIGTTPHLVSISTAYVAGNRRGFAPEELLTESHFAVAMDWRAEAASVRRGRDSIEDESRTPERLTEFATEADAELGAAGTAALSAKREQIRQRWVRTRLVEVGRARSGSLGFPDSYGLTKALAEAALTETRGAVPLTIVRPSIIESAVAEPFPGWIRGFRMAEPIIISYARGLLQDFPGTPEGTLDVIPVDMVAAAVCAVAADGPAADGGPNVVQVASGAVNPFRFADLHDWSHAWFCENPIYDERNQPISPPRWSYPSRKRVRTQLDRARRTLLAGEKVLSALPVRGEKAGIAAEFAEKRALVERALSYVELYSGYVECQATFGIDNLLALQESLTPDDRQNFDFDPGQIDWHRYLTEIHLPSVIAQGRLKTAPAVRAGADRDTRRRQQVLSPKRHMAAFDLENTLVASNVVASWGWLATKRMPVADRARLVARTLAEAPKLLDLDRHDRSDFLRYFYRRFAGAPVDQVAEDAFEMFSDLLLRQSFPAAIRRVRHHRALGHRTVLITGALDFVIAPFAPLFDDIVCASLTRTRSGSAYTGQLATVPPTGESRAEALLDYAAREGISLANSVAYADSTSDLPMLEAVGFPVAVNPETKLATLARRRGWLIENFRQAPGGPRKLLPLAQPVVRR